MSDVRVPEAELRALIEAVHEPVKTTIEELASPYYFAVQGVLDAAIALVDAFEHAPAPPVAAVRADQQGPERVTVPVGLLQHAELAIRLSGGDSPLAERLRHFAYPEGSTVPGAAPSGADQQEPAMDWYCVAAEGGLPFDHCSPENPMHSAPCGPWDRSPAAAAPSTPGAPEADAWIVCPEHGPDCDGDECCCIDRHRAPPPAVQGAPGHAAWCALPPDHADTCKPGAPGGES